MRQAANILAPRGSRRRHYAARLLRKAGLINTKIAIEYYDYITTLERAQIPLYPEHLEENIKFSIVIPAYNTPDKYLQPLVRSILLQTYQNWELILVNASTDEKSSNRIQKLTETDTRIAVVNVPNKGISANTNAGIERATGEYIIFVDHDDLVDHQALNEIRQAIQADPEAGLIYSDEDKVSEDGKRFSAPHFKPNWSPDMMNCVNYITHLVAIKKSIVDKVGPLDPDKDGAQDYDFLLRVIDSGTKIVHIPEVLYHWREADNSTARSLDFKPEATKAGVVALQDHLVRQGIRNAEVENRHNRPGFYKVVYAPPETITIVVAPFASPRVIKQYVERLVTRTATGAINTQLIIPSSVKLDPALNQYAEHLEIINLPAENGKKYIAAALEKSSDQLLIINKLVFPINSRWLQELSGVINVGRIAAVAPVIVNDTDCVSDSGYVYEGEDLVKLFRGMPFEDNPTFFGNTEWCRDVNGLTGSVVLLRKKDFSKFLETASEAKSIAGMIKQFSLEENGKGKNICIWSNVIFNDLTITAPYQANQGSKGKFNPSLVSYGEGFHVVSDDETIINRLALIPVEDENYE